MRKFSALLFLFFLVSFFYIFAKNANAAEDFSLPPGPLQEFKPFKISYTDLNIDKCYVFSILDSSDKEFILSNKSSSFSSCYVGDLEFSGRKVKSFLNFKPLAKDSELLMPELKGGDYHFSVFTQEVGNIYSGNPLRLVPVKSIPFTIQKPQQPSSTSSNTGQGCNIGFQSPDLGTNCTSCINTNYNNLAPDLISTVKTANPNESFDDCNDQQIINYWCNKQNNPTCQSLKFSQCYFYCRPITPTPAPTSTLNSPLPPCKEWDLKKQKCISVDTGLGIPFSTDPADFIKTLFGVLLSVSGGIALLLIIISGYRLMASQGNPEKVQAAKETLTSAIIGLVFIIFAMAILQIIGVDILHIPGFEK